MTGKNFWSIIIKAFLLFLILSTYLSHAQDNRKSLQKALDDDNSKYTNVGNLGFTVTNVEQLRDFYSSVVGWNPSPVNMGNYDDYNMLTADEQPAAGVCHARGPNAELPAQWLIYINVENIDNSVAKCRELGGEIIAGPKNMGDYGRFCVIKDPAGAVCALFEPGNKE